jgi:diacylglycerol kinase family enzyme
MNMGDGFHMAIETDAGSFEDDYFFGAISNLSVIDGTNLNNESFKNNDGVMEMLLIRKPASRSQAKEALKTLQDGSVDHPLIQISQIKKASFISGSDIAWSFDGEFGGIQKEAGLEVLKEALTVLGGQQSA